MFILRLSPNERMRSPIESVNYIMILLSGKIFNVIEQGIFGRIVSIPLPVKATESRKCSHI